MNCLTEDITEINQKPGCKFWHVHEPLIRGHNMILMATYNKSVTICSLQNRDPKARENSNE